MSKGANRPLPTGIVQAVLRHRPGLGGPDIDASALLVTDRGKVRDDSDFVFYNAPVHPNGAVRHVGKDDAAGTETLEVHLGSIEPAIDKVVLAASADGGTFGQVPGLAMSLLDDRGTLLAQFDISDASIETAFVFGELYRRGGEWKFRAVGQGYSTGLAGLATDFGINVDSDDSPSTTAAAPAATATTPRPSDATTASEVARVTLKKQRQISLEKRAAAEAPQIVNLIKTAAVSLEKRGLGEHTARVALCLDISASMSRLYRSQKIQKLIERVLALALRFDDDGAVDVFLFGSSGHVAGTLDLTNVSGYTDAMLKKFRYENGTSYPLAMRLIRKHYFGSDEVRATIHRDPVPVYCMFVTDGQTSDERGATEQVRSSSYEPLFWQFIAIGESARKVAPRSASRKSLFRSAPTPPRRVLSEFRFLEELDNMSGRNVDNADFFAVADPTSIPDNELFDLMMTEYPDWLREIAAKGMR
ncbi:VWA domain-containing protein [Pseudonocardia saturnea]